MDYRLKWALFSGTMAIVTGAAAMVMTGNNAVFQGFLCGINLACATLQLVLYKNKIENDRTIAALQQEIDKNNADLQKRKGDDYYLSGL